MVYADHRLILVSGHLFLETLGVSGRDQRPDRRIVELIDGTVVDQGLFCRGKFLVQPIFIHDLLHGLSHLRVLLAGYTHGIPLDERDIPVSVEILYLEQQFPDMGTVYAGLDDGDVIDFIEHQLMRVGGYDGVYLIDERQSLGVLLGDAVRHFHIRADVHQEDNHIDLALFL